MRRLLASAVAAGAIFAGWTSPAGAQSGSQAVRAPCTQFGSAAGTCLQGGSPAVVSTLAGKNALSSITAGATAQIGTGGTAVCAASHVCDSLSGEIALTTGTGTLAAGTLFTLNFADTRTNLTNCVVVQNTQAGVGALSKLLWTPTTTTLAFGAGAAAVASTAYVFDYFCPGG
jgi:hypothetical protein